LLALHEWPSALHTPAQSAWSEQLCKARRLRQNALAPGECSPLGSDEKAEAAPLDEQETGFRSLAQAPEGLNNCGTG